VFNREGCRKYLNAGERKSFLRVIRRERDPLRQSFLFVLFYTGCRISEGLNMETRRIDSRARSVVFETLKQRRKEVYRSVPVPTWLSKLLLRISSENAPTEKLWKFSRTTAYRLVKKAMKEAKVSGSMASPKGLRHSHGVTCVTKAIPLTQIAKWLGHSRLETTAIYLNMDEKLERALAQRVWK
jgi:integrase/recombinase XerD